MHGGDPITAGLEELNMVTVMFVPAAVMDDGATVPDGFMTGFEVMLSKPALLEGD